MFGVPFYRSDRPKECQETQVGSLTLLKVCTFTVQGKSSTLRRMASIKDVICDGKVESLHAVVETGGNKFVCFTRLSPESWVLCVTDGFDLWRLELDLDDLDARRDLAEVASIDAYVSRFRSAFVIGDIQVAQVGVKVSMKVGQGVKTLSFDLYEAKSIDKKTELQSVLFRLAEGLTDLELKLEAANQQVETLKQQKMTAATSGGGGGLFDLDSKKKKNQPKVQPRQTGMSVINPGSRKRKAPEGVIYD